MNKSRATMLVVDDEEYVRKLLERILEPAGYEVVTADGAQEASDRLSHAGIDLVLLDIRMPGKSGLEFLPEIRASYPDTAVIMVTATADMDIAIRCMKQGACDYISKPINTEWVITGVNRALERRNLELENKGYRQHLEDTVTVQAEKIRTSLLNSITALAYALEAKDKYTGGHSQSVAKIAAAIAEEMDLPRDSVDKIKLAGQLHDIGKIGVMESILNKPSRLTDEEFQRMQKHPEIGEHILAPITDDKELLMLVRGHHERFDGSGYPDHLTNTDIPLGARILAIADSYEAMTSERPYRKALDVSTALSELERSCGTQFDIEAFAAFLRSRKVLPPN